MPFVLYFTIQNVVVLDSSVVSI